MTHTTENSKEVLQMEWKSKIPFTFQFGNHLIETNQQVICRLMENDYDTIEEAQANAELIVKAVNERQKLLDSNRELLAQLENALTIIVGYKREEAAQWENRPEYRDSFANNHPHVKAMEATINNAKNL